jgi:G3E family GTPase
MPRMDHSLQEYSQMSKAAPKPVTILTGFLGAGKTTLLQRLLAEPDGVRFGVLVNDFGAVNIDASLVAEADGDRVALSNGCVCCSIRDDLLAAVARLLDVDTPPDRLVIEASGVSRPLAIIDALGDDPRLGIDGVFCLIDAAGFETLDYADTELAMDQAFGSDVALINKTDLVDSATVARIEATLREAMPRLRCLPTVEAAVPRALLFGPDVVRAASAEGCGHPGHGAGRGHTHAHDDHHDHAHDHAAAFVAGTLRRAEPLEESAFRAAMATLPEGLLRAKGILDIGGARGVFQLVGKRRSLRIDAGPPPAESLIVAIARTGRLDMEGLARTLGMEAAVTVAQ